MRLYRFTLSIFISALAVTTVCVFGVTGAFAQTLPGSAEPGRIEKQFEVPTQPKSVLEPIIPDVDGKPLPPEKAAEIKLTLQGVVFEGRTALAEADLLPLYESLLGKEITLLQAYEIADAVTAKYRSEGYILSRAVIAAQKISGGIITISIVEGYINQIIIKGDAKKSVDLLRTYSDKIQASRPLNIATLERYLLLANDIPGITAKSVLRPAANMPGAADLVLMITHKPVDGSLSLDNHGSAYVGPYQVSATIAENDLIAGGERTQLSYTLANPLGANQRKELGFLRLSHNRIVGNEGASVSLSLSHSKSEPGDTLKVQEVKSSSNSLTLGASYPMIRARAENLSLMGGFSYQNSKSDLLGARLTDDKLRSVNAGISYDFVGSPGGITLLGATITQGLSILGSTDGNSPNPSRADGRDDFTKIVANISHLQKIGGGFNLLASASGQYSADPLLAAEEFGVGGGGFGRGYDASEITGDKGLAAKLELQYGRKSDLTYLRDYQAYAFYDAGAVWDKGVSGRDSLASTGIGVRMNLTDSVSGGLELAKPLTRGVATNSADPNAPRLFFSLTARY